MQQEALPRQSSAADDVSGRLRRFAARKVWLPRSAYTALPYLYIFLGIYAMTAALFLRHWSWIVPYLVLIGVGCVHGGAYVLSLRFRRQQQERRTGAALRSDDSGDAANLRR